MPGSTKGIAPEVPVLGVLLAWNLLSALVVPGAGDIPLNVCAAAALVLLARRAGLSWDGLGLRRDRLGRGLRVGAVAFALVVVTVVAAALVPAFAPAFADDRYATLGTTEALYVTLVRIPVATALAEEVAFRGVLLGMLLRRWPRGWAVWLTSLAFGLWHVAPALSSLDGSAAGGFADGPWGAVAVVAGQVAVTMSAGLVLAWLRFRGEHVIAPALAHWAVNGSAVAAVVLLGSGAHS